MGTIAVKIKLMPTSPDVDLEGIKEKAKALIEEKGGMNVSFEEEPVAFGLNAVIAFFGFKEGKDLDSVEEELGKVDNVNSAQTIDVRRAFG